MFVEFLFILYYSDSQQLKTAHNVCAAAEKENLNTLCLLTLRVFIFVNAHKRHILYHE